MLVRGNYSGKLLTRQNVRVRELGSMWELPSTRHAAVECRTSATVFPGRYDLGPLKGASISTFKAGNAPVAFPVLHGVVGGGNHLL